MLCFDLNNRFQNALEKRTTMKDDPNQPNPDDLDGPPRGDGDCGGGEGGGEPSRGAEPDPPPRRNASPYFRDRVPADYRPEEMPRRPARSPQANPNVRMATWDDLVKAAQTVSRGGEGEVLSLGMVTLTEDDPTGVRLVADEAGLLPFTGPGRARHTLCVGPTGSGKTLTFAFPMLEQIANHTSESVVWMNPRGPIGTQEVIAVMRAGGQKVRPVVFAPGDPTRSVGFNLLEHARDHDELADLIEAVMDAKSRSRSGDSGYWDQVASKLLWPLLSHPAIHSLAEAAAVMESEDSFKRFVKEHRGEVLKGFKTFLETQSQNAATNLADVGSRLKALAFNDEQNAVLSGQHEVDLHALVRGDQRFVLIIEADEAEFRNHAAAINAVLRMLFTAVSREARTMPNNRLSRGITMILDEFGNLPAINGFAEIVNTMRSRGVNVVVLLQTLAQLTLYGDQAGAVLAGLTNKVFMCSELAAGDRRAAQDLAGGTLVDRWQESQIWNAETERYEPSGRCCVTEHRPLLSADDFILRDHPVYGGYTVAFLAGLPPVLGHLRASWDLPTLWTTLERGRSRRNRRTRRVPLPAWNEEADPVESAPAYLSDLRGLPRVGPQTIHRRLRRHLVALRADSKETGPRAYLEHLEELWRDRPAELLRLVVALRVCGGSLDDLLAARKQTGTDDREVNLKFVEYLLLRRKWEEDDDVAF